MTSEEHYTPSNVNQFSLLRSNKKSISIDETTSPISNRSAKKCKLVEERIDQVSDNNSRTPFRTNSENVKNYPESDITLISMRKGECLDFYGSTMICAIQGSFDVMGYKLTPNEAAVCKILKCDGLCDNELVELFQGHQLLFFPCFSPKSSSLLSIECNGVTYSTTEKKRSDALPSLSQQLTTTLEDLKFWKDFSKIVSEFVCAHADSCILALRSANWSNIDGIEKSASIFRDLFQSSSNEIQTVENHIKIRGLYPVTENSTALFPVVIPKGWKNFAEKITRCIPMIQSKSPVICVTGGRNVGKSTFSRYMTNVLLDQYSCVAFLDMDLGQSEFNPSCILSLRLVYFPLLGPSFTHQILTPSSNDNISKSIFIGSTSPKNDPDAYMAAVFHLLHHFNSSIHTLGIDPTLVPLIINTQGWIKGIGFDLLTHFVGSVQPNFVVCLEPPASQQYEVVYSGITISEELSQNLNCQIIYENADDSQLSLTGMNLLPITSIEDCMVRTKLHPADFRDLALMTYFSQSVCNPSLPVVYTSLSNPDNKLNIPYVAWWIFDEPLTSRLPYCVEWNSDLTVAFVNGEVAPSQSLYALNATLVALVANNEESIEVKDQLKLAYALPPNETSRLLGLGIIRSIITTPAVEESLLPKINLQVLSPISLDTIENANVIVRGCGLEFPVTMLISGYEHSSVSLPYTTFTTPEGLGSVAKRTRNNIQRRKNNK